MAEEKSAKTQAKYTKEDLKRLQSYPLWRKIQITKSRIIEFQQEFQNKTYIYFFLLLFISVTHITINCNVPTTSIANEKFPLNISVATVSMNSINHHLASRQATVQSLRLLQVPPHRQYHHCLNQIQIWLDSVPI